MSRRKAGNPNLVEEMVSVAGDEEEDTFGDEDLNLGQEEANAYIAAHSGGAPGKRDRGSSFQPQQDVGDELDEIVHAATHRRRRRVSRTRGGVYRRNQQQEEEEEDPGGFHMSMGSMGAGAEADGSPAWNQPGIFLWDWNAGTPFDRFDFPAMLRHMSRKAEMLSEPFIRFVAGVATKSGSSLELAMVDSSLPKVHIGARSVWDLTAGSALGSNTLASLMALVLLEQLGRAPAEPVKGARVSPPLSPILVKKERARTEAHVGAALDMLERHQRGYQIPLVAAHSKGGNGDIQLIGPNLTGMPWGQQAGGPADNPLLATIVELLSSFTSIGNTQRWLWNELPENSGWSLVKPEMLEMINTGYREIQGIGGTQSGFKLIHLITSPGVNVKFAGLVAGMINAVPGPMQFPNFSSYGAGGRSLVGARVSSGILSQMRSANAVKAALKWFRNVRYAANPQVTEIESRGPIDLEKLKAEKLGFDRALQVIDDLFVHPATGFWFNNAQFSADSRRTAIDLYDRLKAVAEAQDNVQRAQLARDEARRQQVIPTQDPMQTAAQYQDQLQALRQAIDLPLKQATDALELERQRIRAIQERINTNLQPVAAAANPTMDHAFLNDASFFAPFVGYDAMPNMILYGLANPWNRAAQGNILRERPRSSAVIEDALTDAISAMERIMRRTALWRISPPLVAKLNRAFIDAMTVLRSARQLSEKIRRDIAFLGSMTEDEKRVLKHFKPADFKRPTNWLYPASPYVEDMRGY